MGRLPRLTVPRKSPGCHRSADAGGAEGFPGGLCTPRGLWPPLQHRAASCAPLLSSPHSVSSIAGVAKSCVCAPQAAPCPRAVLPVPMQPQGPYPASVPSSATPWGQTCWDWGWRGPGAPRAAFPRKSGGCSFIRACLQPSHSSWLLQPCRGQPSSRGCWPRGHDASTHGGGNRAPKALPARPR